MTSANSSRTAIHPCPVCWRCLLKAMQFQHAFDEDAQGMMEVEPEPNIIIPFDPTDAASVQRTFHMFGVACQTIAAASRLIDLMPGNDQWIISR